MQLERGIFLLHRAEEILVPLQRQVGIVPALEQQLPAAERDRLVDLSEDLLEPEHVAFRRTHGPIERAEVAPGHADVRVVDVAIDDVGDDAVGVLAGADLVGQLAEERRRRAAVQLERVGRFEPSSIRSRRERSLTVIGKTAAAPSRSTTPDAARPARSILAVPASSRLTQRVLDILSQIRPAERGTIRTAVGRPRSAPTCDAAAPWRRPAPRPLRERASRRPAQNAHTNGKPVSARHCSPRSILFAPSRS